MPRTVKVPEVKAAADTSSPGAHVHATYHCMTAESTCMVTASHFTPGLEAAPLAPEQAAPLAQSLLQCKQHQVSRTAAASD